MNTIYRIRESLQWDQEKMADEMNVTAVTVKRWENEDGIPGKAAQEKLPRRSLSLYARRKK